MSVIWESANWIRQFRMLPFHILSDIYITYLLIIIYDKDIKSYIIYEKKIMYKDFLSGMNTHPHTEDQATCTYFFPKHLLVTCKGTLYS